MLNLTVVGTGYVGLVTGVCLAEVGHKVTCLDTNKEKINLLNNNISPIYEEGLELLMQKNFDRQLITYTDDKSMAYSKPDAIFIAVGTPELEDGSPNLIYIYEVIDDVINIIKKDCLIIIKSTVPVGTNKKIKDYIKTNMKTKLNIDIASNPEFLSQGTAVRDTLHASRIVFGTETKFAKDLLYKIYNPFNIPIVSTDINSAEMIKYASNNFLALKISFMNDIANLCEIVGSDIEEVAKGIGYDDRIGNKFLKAGLGYGGSCFPKDTKALNWMASSNGYDLKTIKATIDVNEKQKTILIDKSRKYFKTFKNVNVAILGLTFKPNTDDLRDSPALKNIDILLDEGAIINAFDPVGNANCKKIYGNKINFCLSIKEALKNVDVCFIFTEWDEIKNTNVETFINNMRRPLIFDGRNCYKRELMEFNNIEYHSIGR